MELEKACARNRVNPGGKAPLAVGDSVMLLAVPRLARIGFKVNAQGCRQWGQGERVLRRYKRAEKLPHLVVIGLGADGSITAPDAPPRPGDSRAEAIAGVDRAAGAGRWEPATTPTWCATPRAPTTGGCYYSTGFVTATSIEMAGSSPTAST